MWNAENTKFLRTYYPHFGGQWVASELGFTLGQVRSKANKLKLTLLPRSERRCVDCDVIGLHEDRRTGLRCLDCFNQRRRYIRRSRNKTRKERWNELLRSARYRSSVPCDLDVDFLEALFDLQKGRCAYSGKEMIFSPWGTSRNPWAVSIDQIAAGKGYTRDNIVLVCWAVNCGKNAFDLETYIEICIAVTEKFNKLTDQ